MRFETLVERCRREWPCFEDRKRLAAARHPQDRGLAHVLDEVPGMATENKLKLLNLAVAAMEPGEVYVEVGSYRGASLVGAAMGNPQAAIFACDNFSQFEGAAKILKETLKNHCAPGQVRFFDTDFRDFMAEAPWAPAKVGAYFYDGGHSFADQYEALALALPHLADEAAIIIDDTNKRNVRSANALFRRQMPGLDLVLDLRTPRNHSPTWWNGVQLYRYRRLDDPPAPPSFGPAFTLRKFFWDDVFLASRHRYRALRSRLKPRR